MSSKLSNVRMAAITETAPQISETLKLISHPTRLIVMYAILDKARTVNELVALSGLSQSALSQHLAKFRGAGLVTTERKGQEILYQLNNAKVEAILGLLETLYCRL
ncbi:helix-turn-helix transcriptional regulator [Asticcacaulis sp. AND118]|uniref:ArsR/SmtB family transcription factor n=1 Tax=Asticcacaulis sp. AND118 TaxID=2840468 RepID=UPI001CFF59EA|nr:metalloregulator ArsR/SmtB family transcription factor [Asticcacaulis sp. AND118]UDF05782.1 metalloregulator ArsR/SmtB family transcription factor [Asticcacaulis sp. AND118]